jgi:hypothetical protein
MDMVSLLPGHSAELDMFFAIIMEIVLIAVVFGLDYDGPSGWKDVVVKIQLHRFEEEAAEYGLNSQVLSIGKMHDTWSRSHPSVIPALDTIDVPCFFVSVDVVKIESADRLPKRENLRVRVVDLRLGYSLRQLQQVVHVRRQGI